MYESTIREKLRTLESLDETDGLQREELINDIAYDIARLGRIPSFVPEYFLPSIVNSTRKRIQDLNDTVKETEDFNFDVRKRLGEMPIDGMVLQYSGERAWKSGFVPTLGASRNQGFERFPTIEEVIRAHLMYQTQADTLNTYQKQTVLEFWRNPHWLQVAAVAQYGRDIPYPGYVQLYSISFEGEIKTSEEKYEEIGRIPLNLFRHDGKTHYSARSNELPLEFQKIIFGDAAPDKPCKLSVSVHCGPLAIKIGQFIEIGIDRTAEGAVGTGVRYLNV